MKASLIFSITMLLFIALMGCNKNKKNPVPVPSPVAQDPCQNKVCQNGGHCESGNCICLDGYAGVNCEIDNRPACVKNHTGTISIQNNHALTVGILLDNNKMGTIPSGGAMGPIVVAIGSHTIEYQLHNPLGGWYTVSSSSAYIGEDCGKSDWVFHM